MQTHKFKGKLFDIDFSSVKKSNLYGILRLNAEFYEPEILKIRNSLILKKADNLGNLAKYIKRGIQPKYSDGNIKVLRSVNIRESGFSNDRQKYTDEVFYSSKKSGQIEYGDILLTSTGVGTLGRISINLSSEKYFIDGHITVLRKLKYINSSYLYSYLNSNIGIAQINKLYNGTSGQIEIYPDNLSEILVPIPSQPFQQKIEFLVTESYKQKEISEKLYKEAEDILLEEFNLFDYKPKTKTIKFDSGIEMEVEENHSTTNYSILKKTDRFDAEYWDCKYEEIIDKIKSYELGFKKLKYFVIKYTSGYNYRSSEYDDKGIPVIRINNITKKGINLGNVAYISEEYSNKSKENIATPNDILISMSGTIGNCALIPNDIGKVCINQRILSIRTNIINKNYLVLLLNSILGALQLNRVGVGGVQTNLSSKNILDIKIPSINNNIQGKMEEKIQKSFKAENKSKKMLEVAKKAVEIYIEKKEEDGLKFIKDSINYS